MTKSEQHTRPGMDKEKGKMPALRSRRLFGFLGALLGALTTTGCYNTPVDTSAQARGPAPLRMPSPAGQGSCCFEDTVTGGQLFEMYCSYCHNAPALAERPFSNYRNVVAHMRVRANLTGKGYAKLMEWIRRWHDVPPGHPPIEPAPKRFTYGQPINELKPKPGETPTPPATLPPEMPLPHSAPVGPDQSAPGH